MAPPGSGELKLHHPGAPIHLVEKFCRGQIASAPAGSAGAFRPMVMVVGLCLLQFAHCIRALCLRHTVRFVGYAIDLQTN